MPDVSKVIYDTSGEIIDGPVYSVNGERREVNKVVYGVTTLIDITDSTVTSNNLLRGNVAYSADGSRVVGNIDQTIEHLEVGGTVSLDENDYMEFDDSGGGTAAISVVDTADSHGGTVRTITALDISDTTAVASDVAQGKYFYTAAGVKTAGTASGSTPSATAHTIYFEFSDETNTTITAYYDSTFISNAITATEPTTYGGKTVTLAQLDGVTWYEVSGDIPLNTELVDYTAVTSGKYVDDSSGAIVNGESWDCVTDYLPIDPSMTFSFISKAWYGIGFYNASKTPIRGYLANDLGTASGDYIHGTISPSVIPSNAVYVVLTGNPYSLTSNSLSLIRTA